MAATDPIEIASDVLRIRILPHGAALVGVRFIGAAQNMVLGFVDPADHAKVPVYAGALVGPVANRVTGGHVNIDGTQYQMPCNEAGITALHSGPDGLDTQVWRVTAYMPDSVTLTCALPDGHGGLPGNRRFVATYTVSGDTLSLRIAAQTDKPTPINVAAHPYWNLDGCADISGHTLQIEADELLPTDADNLPTGARLPLAESPFDFRTPRAIPLDPALDLAFCLTDHMRADPHPAAILTGSTGTALHIATNAPSLQVYNAAYLPSDTQPTENFPTLAPFAAIALEPQHWPDAPNNADFPEIILHPDEKFDQITHYRLTKQTI